jgi:leader peptidase (prepilin peptidase)/N-methyltransferase
MLWLRYGPGIPLAAAALYTCFLIVIAFIDLAHQIIPNRIVYPAMGFALLGAFITPGLAPSSAILGGLVGFGFLFLVVFVNPAGMGMGDVRLAAFIGLITGFPSVVVALLTAIVLGGLVGALLLLSRLKSRKDPIPFGPFLVLGAFFSLLCGMDLIYSYLAYVMA